jgi:hypothetical protein
VARGWGAFVLSADPPGRKIGLRSSLFSIF